MKRNRYTYILYFITLVIVITFGIQLYWNYKNYQTSKQQLINDVHASLDNAVDLYYEDIARNTTIGFASRSNDLQKAINNGKLKSILTRIDSLEVQKRSFDFLDTTNFKGVSIFRGKETDTIDEFLQILKIKDSSKVQIQVNHSTDSIKVSQNPFEILTSKIVISIEEDEADLKKIDSLFKNQLAQKDLQIDYNMTFSNMKTDSVQTTWSTEKFNDTNQSLTAVSNSTYLPSKSTLVLLYNNITKTILKRNILGLLLSFMLMISVIACLLYLLSIINQQKQLSELKNDLISNITHEFKTPIATVSAALEGIQVFNQKNDKEKTNKYLNISKEQLGKLTVMVEKILETATLDSSKLELHPEEIDLVEMVRNIVQHYSENLYDKEINLMFSKPEIIAKVDIFHFENALNNLIDNAIKYGGNIINVSLTVLNPNLIIEVIDNGGYIGKLHKEKIFDKFYRIPKGNKHDIKGFGIGLFYTRVIIEKHKGTIQLLTEKNSTNFKITLPYE